MTYSDTRRDNNVMDIDNLVAIDVHTHVHRSVNAPKANPGDNEHLAAMAAYFKTEAASFTVEGDWTFGHGVSVAGTVSLDRPKTAQRVAPGTALGADA